MNSMVIMALTVIGIVIIAAAAAVIIAEEVMTARTEHLLWTALVAAALAIAAWTNSLVGK